MKPAIAITTHANSAHIQLLLDNLRAAYIPAGVPLVVAVDRGTGRENTTTQLPAIDWSYGPVEMIVHREPLGCAQNHAFAASQVHEYEALIVLPDNVLVSPTFYEYALQALETYANDMRIAGLSLFSLWANCLTGQPFIPLLDQGDSFFVANAWPDGCIYTRSQWAAFVAWLDQQTQLAPDLHAGNRIASYLAANLPKGWLRYLAHSGRSVVFPRSSLVTAAPGGDIRLNGVRQAPLNRFKRQFRLAALDQSVAVYDASFELLPDRLIRLAEHFSTYDFEMDLYGTRDLAGVATDYLVTSRRCKDPVKSWAKLMRPMEANLIADLPGAELHLAQVSDVDGSQSAARAAWRHNDAYFGRYDDPGLRHELAGQAAARWRRRAARKSGGH